MGVMIMDEGDGSGTIGLGDGTEEKQAVRCVPRVVVLMWDKVTLVPSVCVRVLLLFCCLGIMALGVSLFTAAFLFLLP